MGFFCYSLCVKDTPLNKFVEQVMEIEADYAGMGGASAGILGATGTNGQIVNDLRAHAMAFASELVKRSPNQKKLFELSYQVEGSLQSVKLVNGISDAKFEALISDLHALTDKAA
jgi:hypothetical protein